MTPLSRRTDSTSSLPSTNVAVSKSLSFLSPFVLLQHVLRQLLVLSRILLLYVPISEVHSAPQVFGPLAQKLAFHALPTSRNVPVPFSLLLPFIGLLLRRILFVRRQSRFSFYSSGPQCLQYG